MATLSTAAYYRAAADEDARRMYRLERLLDQCWVRPMLQLISFKQMARRKMEQSYFVDGR